MVRVVMPQHAAALYFSWCTQQQNMTRLCLGAYVLSV